MIRRACAEISLKKFVWKADKLIIASFPGAVRCRASRVEAGMGPCGCWPLALLARVRVELVVLLRQSVGL